MFIYLSPPHTNTCTWHIQDSQHARETNSLHFGVFFSLSCSYFLHYKPILISGSWKYSISPQISDCLYSRLSPQSSNSSHSKGTNCFFYRSRDNCFHENCCKQILNFLKAFFYLFLFMCMWFYPDTLILRSKVYIPRSQIDGFSASEFIQSKCDIARTVWDQKSIWSGVNKPPIGLAFWN